MNMRNAAKSIKAIRILLVEDNEGDAFLMNELLQESFLEAATLCHVGTLKEGCDKLVENRDFDLVLLDLNLPDGQGIANLRHIKTNAPETAVIILTGLNDQELAHQLLNEGAQDYLQKGRIDTESLWRAIRYAIERQRMTVKLAKAREVERYLAYYDALTALPNRELFNSYLSEAIKRGKRHSESCLAVMFIDLDGFKTVNDSLGHAAGDSLLKVVASRLKNAVRDDDIVARLSGDEFTIILENLAEQSNAVKVAENVLKAIRRPVPLGDEIAHISASIGISYYPFDGQSAEALLKHADIAMYQAKKSQKNSFQLFTPVMDTQAAQRFYLEKHLHRALEKKELEVHYQPLLDLHTGQVVSLEALVRWNRGSNVMMAPDSFIPIAEDNGLIVPIGKWILQRACEDLKKLHQQGFPKLQVAVNLSMRQFNEKSLYRNVMEALRQNSLEPGFLILEITESHIMRDPKETLSTLIRFRREGIQVSIDDFGTGYSSLSQLKTLPVDSLKIDRSFIDGIPDNKDDSSITSAIVALARNLELSVVAEGVETQQQVAFLNSISCNRIQGFHISKPLVFETLAESLMNCQISISNVPKNLFTF